MSGVTIDGNVIILHNNIISNVKEPVGPKDAATKSYCDNISMNLQLLDSDTLKDDLSQTQQVNARGRKAEWTAGEANVNGGLTIINFGTASAVPCTSVPRSSSIGLIGVCLRTSAEGEPVQIMGSNGFCTALTTLFPPIPSPISLTPNNSGDTIPSGSYMFTDAGQVGEQYRRRRAYEMEFDAGVGNTWTIDIATLSFVHDSKSMKQLLGLQTSSDGLNWINAAVPWMLTSRDPNPPWDKRRGDDPLGGWIFPSDTSTVPATLLEMNFRFIKFIVASNTSSPIPAWSMTVTSSTFVIDTIRTGDTVYVCESTPATIAKIGTWMIGHAVSPSNDVNETVIVLS